MCIRAKLNMWICSSLQGQNRTGYISCMLTLLHIRFNVGRFDWPVYLISVQTTSKNRLNCWHNNDAFRFFSLFLFSVFWIIWYKKTTNSNNSNVKKKGCRDERRKVTTISIPIERVYEKRNERTTTTRKWMYITGYGLNRPLIDTINKPSHRFCWMLLCNAFRFHTFPQLFFYFTRALVKQ